MSDDEGTEMIEGMSDDLLAAYALNACEPEEAARIERYLARHPEAVAALTRLSTAAAWIGATEALSPPESLRGSILAAARARAGAAPDDVLGVLRDLADGFDVLVRGLGPADLSAGTANGLSVRDLVIHLAAQESMVTSALAGTEPPVSPLVTIDERTAAFVEVFAVRPLDDVRDLWRDSIDDIIEWGASGAEQGHVPWFGQEVPRDVVLAIRAFETWIHSDDIRRALGRPLEPPRAGQLHLMAEFSMESLPTWLALTGRARPGRTARMVLTGDGGGDWLVPLGPGEADAETVDVTVEVDVVDWCHRVGERITTDAIRVRVEGDAALAGDILESASVLATL